MRLVLGFLVGCGNQVGGNNVSDDGGGGETGIGQGDDVDPPVIDFVPLDENQPSGTDVVLTAGISDEGTGIFTATLFYWNETGRVTDASKIAFLDQGDGTWNATIKADEQRDGGMWYYLSAIDRAQNEAFSPEDGGDSPYHFGYTD